MQRRKPIQRAFTKRLVGMPPEDDTASIAVEEPPGPPEKKRGRKPKYKNDEERKAVDASRKRDERLTKKAKEIIAAHPDSLGSHGESSGGYSPQKVEAVVGAQQRAQAIGLGTDNDPDAPTLGAPDRRRNSTPPANPDTAKGSEADEKEKDSSFVANAFRRQAHSLRQWVRGKTKRVCPQNHAALAKSQRDTLVKVYCRSCGLLIIRPKNSSDAS